MKKKKVMLRLTLLLGATKRMIRNNIILTTVLFCTQVILANPMEKSKDFINLSCTTSWNCTTFVQDITLENFTIPQSKQEM